MTPLLRGKATDFRVLTYIVTKQKRVGCYSVNVTGNGVRNKEIRVTLVVGLVGGYYVGYLPTHKDVEQYKYNFEYYRDKYLKECEIYKDIIHVAGNKQMDDYSKLYYIRSTYCKKDIKSIGKAVQKLNNLLV